VFSFTYHFSPLMAATSMVDSVDTDDESDDSTLEDKELIKRLKQGQARMEQAWFFSFCYSSDISIFFKSFR